LQQEFVALVDRHLQAIAARHLGRELTSAELQGFFRRSSPLRFVKDEVLYGQGEAADTAMLLLEGALTVEVQREDGSASRTIGAIVPGEIFGELGLFGVGRGHTRSATVRASSDGRCLLLLPEIFSLQPADASVIAVQAKLIDDIARRIQSTDQAVDQVWAEREAARAGPRPPASWRARLRELLWGSA